VRVGQARVAAAEAMGQALVVDAQQMEHRRVQVMDLGLVLDGVIAVVIGRSMDRSSLDASPGEPDGEATGVVVAAVLSARLSSIAPSRSTRERPCQGPQRGAGAGR
jgi:hypothetical protein